MGKGRIAGIDRPALAGGVIVIAVLVVAQSVVHLLVVLRLHRVDTLVDLDRSNGLPDIVSTAALMLAALGAGAVARRERGLQRVAAGLLASLLAALMLADAFHDGAHPSSAKGWYVIGLVAVAAGLLTVAALCAAPRAQVTLAIAVLGLGTSFLVTGLNRFDHRFERGREDPIAEYQIVAKDGLELLGWSLVALALWDEALRRRNFVRAAVTAPASRGRAASRRRAA
jgi:hypothetical protein